MVGFELKAETVYNVECYSNHYLKVPKWVPLIGDMPLLKRKTPKLKWRDSFKNLVTTVGKNKVLDSTFSTGVTSPTWYVGLKGSGTPLAADTMASHSSWSELTSFSNATRPAFTPGSIASGSVDNSASKAVFNINATDTIVGAFMVNNSTISGTSGTLYGVGDFSSSRSVANGDTLNVTVTLTQS